MPPKKKKDSDEIKEKALIAYSFPMGTVSVFPGLIPAPSEAPKQPWILKEVFPFPGYDHRCFIDCTQTVQ